MKKILAMLLVFHIICLSGCGNEQSADANKDIESDINMNDSNIENKNSEITEDKIPWEHVDVAPIIVENGNFILDFEQLKNCVNNQAEQALIDGEAVEKDSGGKRVQSYMGKYGIEYCIFYDENDKPHMLSVIAPKAIEEDKDKEDEFLDRCCYLTLACYPENTDVVPGIIQLWFDRDDDLSGKKYFTLEDQVVCSYTESAAFIMYSITCL